MFASATSSFGVIPCSLDNFSILLVRVVIARSVLGAFNRVRVLKYSCQISSLTPWGVRGVFSFLVLFLVVVVFRGFDGCLMVVSDGPKCAKAYPIRLIMVPLVVVLRLQKTPLMVALSQAPRKLCRVNLNCVQPTFPTPIFGPS